MAALHTFFCRAHNPGSLLIRGITWSTWSHCGLVTPEGTVIDARAFHGVTERPLQDLLDYASEIAFRDIDVPDPAAGYAFGRAQIGKAYDYLGVAGIGIHREWYDPSKWWCSELLEEAVYMAGRQRLVNQPRRVTPQLSYMMA